MIQFAAGENLVHQIASRANPAVDHEVDLELEINEGDRKIEVNQEIEVGREIDRGVGREIEGKKVRAKNRRKNRKSIERGRLPIRVRPQVGVDRLLEVEVDVKKVDRPLVESRDARKVEVQVAVLENGSIPVIQV